MKDKLTSFERRIETMFMLMQRKKVTIAELADVFSVCRNTAYNDIVFLSRYAPIYTKHGMNGGVYLLENYHSKLFLYLSKEEENLLKDLRKNLTYSEKLIMSNILNKFSMPK